jgi:5-hydroxyisourate hydrolase
MSTISTHVLDTSRGRPAAGVKVRLEILRSVEGWSLLSQGVTDEDGRIKQFVSGEVRLDPGTYRLVFSLAQYFRSLNQPSFYPEISVTFLMEAGEHYHVPLLISPFGYSTYRGS